MTWKVWTLAGPSVLKTDIGDEPIVSSTLAPSAEKTMARKITVSQLHGTREPRQGELNYELKRIMTKHCTKGPLREAVKGVGLAVARLASRFGFNEYECFYDRTTSRRPWREKSWVNESVEVVIFRRRMNGTLSIYRAGATSFPRFFPGPDGRSYANLSAPRDVNVFYTIDEPYTWEKYASKKMPARIKAKQK